LTLVRRVDGEAAQKRGLESMDTPGPPRKTWTLWTSDWNTERRWSCCVWCATRRRARSLPVAGPSDRHDEPWPVLVHDQASRATIGRGDRIGPDLAGISRLRERDGWLAISRRRMW